MSYSSDGLAYGLPHHALKILDVLERSGAEAWVVGGWVRDALLGAPCHDVDVTTSARWQDAKAALVADGIPVHETGTAHGTITAVVDGEPVEVTTYRSDGIYSDHRHPDQVVFVSDVKEDLARRDFTINAMAYHPTRGLLDLFGGREDLERGVIRAVGNPAQRFAEDALRVLRAVRFAARLGFVVEPHTHVALVDAASGLADIAQERIGQEMDGIVRTGKVAWALEAEPEVMCAAIPELTAMIGFDQRSPWHAYTVMDHTIRVCRAVEEFTAGLATPELRWAGFLHDVGKPVTCTIDSIGRGHFWGHPKAGAAMCETILSRMAFPKDFITRVCTLIRYHDHMVYPMTRSIRRTLVKIEQVCPGYARSLIYQLINLKRADAVSKVPRASYYAIELDKVSTAVRKELATNPPLCIADLAVDGRDVMELMHVPAGPVVGSILHELLYAVVNCEIDNDRDQMIKYMTKGL